MKPNPPPSAPRRALLALCLLPACLAATGCATRRSAAAQYDFGPQPASPTAKLPPQLFVVGEVQSPSWLDGAAMLYRLSYSNPQRALPYTESRWSAPPAQLLGARLKAAVVQAGGMVQSGGMVLAGGLVVAAEGRGKAAPVLHTELEEFIQDFSSPQRSEARITLRASLFSGKALQAQHTFSQTVAAASPDAAGGAHALAAASDALIGQVVGWTAAWLSGRHEPGAVSGAP